MVTNLSGNTNPARIPALGIRVLVCIALSILLMVVDHRQNHLDTVRTAIGVAVYPIQVIVDSPFRLWSWFGESTADRNELQVEVARLECLRKSKAASRFGLPHPDLSLSLVSNVLSFETVQKTSNQCLIYRAFLVLNSTISISTLETMGE